MSTQIETLGDALPREIARCRELLVHYDNIGPAGWYGRAAITAVIERAEKAIANNDIVQMVRSFEELKGCE